MRRRRRGCVEGGRECGKGRGVMPGGDAEGPSLCRAPPSHARWNGVILNLSSCVRRPTSRRRHERARRAEMAVGDGDVQPFDRRHRQPRRPRCPSRAAARRWRRLLLGGLVQQAARRPTARSARRPGARRAAPSAPRRRPPRWRRQTAAAPPRARRAAVAASAQSNRRRATVARGAALLHSQQHRLQVDRRDRAVGPEHLLGASVLPRRRRRRAVLRRATARLARRGRHAARWQVFVVEAVGELARPTGRHGPVR